MQMLVRNLCDPFVRDYIFNFFNAMGRKYPIALGLCNVLIRMD